MIKIYYICKYLYRKGENYMKTKIAFFFLLFSFCCFVNSFSQQNDWRAYLEQMAEDMADDDSGTENFMIDNIYEELVSLENSPLNLNTLTLSDIEKIPFLSVDQSQSIISFLEKNRPVYTVFELRNVPLLDYNTVELILPFFYAGEMEKRKLTVEDIAKYGKHEINFRLDKTLNKRAGYGEFPDSVLEQYPNRKYQGEDFYNSFKYSFKYQDKVQMGVVGEKDAGEPFFKQGYQKGYDHYGFHFVLKDMGVVKTLAVGDYRLSFGQGLILNNDFMLSKAWAINNIVRNSQGPKRHFSTAEYGFYRGGAVVVEVKNVDLTVFYSNKRFDANLSKENEITSFKTDGYHRTLGELAKKNNAREQVVGARAKYRFRDLQIGLNAVYHVYDKPLNPTYRIYNHYYLRDKSNFNASIDYSYRWNDFVFGGETARAKNGATATTNMVQYSPSSEFAIFAKWRYLPITYNALHARTFSESNRVQNEQGFYVGTTFNPFRNVSITSYIDFFKFPWLKYSVDTPSKGSDFYLSGSYSIHNKSNIEIRYRYKQMEKNFTLPDDKVARVLPYTVQKLRLRYNNTVKNTWNFITTIDGAMYNRNYFATEKGFMVSQNIGYRGSKNITGDFFFGYFNADSYSVRLFSYEKNILSSFYMPSFYGKGIRLALSARCNITNKLSFSIKCGHTRYFNRETIGSGTELINGNSRTDIYSYLRWRF